MSTELLTTPKFAPGANVAAALRDALRVAVSPAVGYSTDGVAALTTVFRVPPNTLILGTLAEVTAGFAAAVGPALVSLGDSDGASDLFAGDSNIASTGFIAQFIGKHYSAAQDIIATFSNTSSDSTAGSMRFWILYTTETDKRFVKSS